MAKLGLEFNLEDDKFQLGICKFDKSMRDKLYKNHIVLNTFVFLIIVKIVLNAINILNKNNKLFHIIQNKIILSKKKYVQ
jgi:hypothetical protein